ncbi:3-hydroxyisobutyrate dehydrogenase [Chitinophaga eiseniae]|uniref:3-hydroxyisobutyrate dehydrogenase n=1 Tax=Chitinophaga eiseniae TaxID=634771 RepID=A0A1T4MHJ2_9BACT|nr:NAD(P)-binding domain-containing protein [Chitinophaga eiseniae]SJZ66422.1 3-hydroxyisobutyrate dehydrogenase [Chitinophaga eiseniae]
MTGTGKITVIGLGAMGAAIAGALLAKGFHVTVWNRTPEKAALLVQRGAVLASEPAAAIVASPVTIVCVSDYDTATKILDMTGVPATLKGRTLILLSAGTPNDARSLDAWVHAEEGHCLHGGIAAWPRQIGTAEAMITASGDKAVFDQQRSVLEALAGTVHFAGEGPGTAATLTTAAMAYLAGNWIGFCYGALICEKEGLKVDEFGQLMEGFTPMLAAEVRHMGEVIQHNRFSDPESTINTTGLDLRLLLQHTREAGLHTALPELAADIFNKAIAAGYGKEEHAAIIKILRKQDS